VVPGWLKRSVSRLTPSGVGGLVECPTVTCRGYQRFETLTKEAALQLVDEAMSSRRETARYRQAIGELRRLLESGSRDSRK
jgi:hypothetical protein